VSLILYNTYQKVIRKDLSQGAVLSPILYAIYTSKLTLDLDREVNLRYYGIYYKSWQANRTRLEQTISMITERLNQLKLALSPSKIIMVEFNSRRICDPRMYLDIRQ